MFKNFMEKNKKREESTKLNESSSKNKDMKTSKNKNRYSKKIYLILFRNLQNAKKLKIFLKK
jgi:hypothetical protein